MHVTDIEVIPISHRLPDGQGLGDARGFGHDRATTLIRVDTDTGDRVMSVLDGVNDAGNTILLVTHERRIAEHADRIVHLRDGRIQEIETVDGGNDAEDTDDVNDADDTGAV